MDRFKTIQEVDEHGEEMPTGAVTRLVAECQAAGWFILSPSFLGTCFAAADRGYLDCLAYAHEHGCPWDVWTCFAAARRGDLGCLTYAHEHGCPWDKWTCKAAAKHGHLDCLMYAHKHGCPWDVGTCREVATYMANDRFRTIGQLACMRFMRTVHASWVHDPSVRQIALTLARDVARRLLWPKVRLAFRVRRWWFAWKMAAPSQHGTAAASLKRSLEEIATDVGMQPLALSVQPASKRS